MVLFVRRYYLLSLLIQHESELVLLTKLKLRQLDLLYLVLHDGWADNKLDVGLGDSKKLLVARIVEFASKGWETLHKVDQSVQGEASGRLLFCQLAILRLELSQVTRVIVLTHLVFLDDGQEWHQGNEEHLVDR